jgi:hypothetical protein
MRLDEHHQPLQQNEEGHDTEREASWRHYQPIALLKSSLSFLSRCWRPEEDPDDHQKIKYMHTPTNAATSFLKTTTTRSIQEANEIL